MTNEFNTAFHYIKVIGVICGIGLFLITLNRRKAELFAVRLIFQYPFLYKYVVPKTPAPNNLQDVLRSRPEFLKSCDRLTYPNRSIALHDVEEITIHVSDRYTATIPIRIYTPQTKSAIKPPAFIYMHGGGWVKGDISTADEICRHICFYCHCVVFSIGYRLAPEHRYPVPLQDCYDSIQWIKSQHQRYGFRENFIFVGGDSAGGNLAAAVVLKLRDECPDDLSLIKGQILIYPVTHFDFSRESYKKYAEGYVLTADSMKAYWKHYIAGAGSGTWGTSPYESVLLAKLDHLPPALVITAEYDPLLDEGIAYAKKLKESGVLVEHYNYQSMHGFLALCSNFHMAMDAIYKMKNFVAGKAL